MINGMQIDYETADRITVLNLKDYRDCLQHELDMHRLHNKYLHDDDEVRSMYIICCIDDVLKEFGE